MADSGQPKVVRCFICESTGKVEICFILLESAYPIYLIGYRRNAKGEAKLVEESVFLCKLHYSRFDKKGVEN